MIRQLLPKSTVRNGCVPVSLAYLSGQPMSKILKLRAACALRNWRGQPRACRVGTPMEVVVRMMRALGTWQEVEGYYTINGLRRDFPFGTFLVIAKSQCRNQYTGRVSMVCHALVVEQQAVRCPAGKPQEWLDNSEVLRAYRLVETLPVIGCGEGKIFSRIDLTSDE